MCVPSQSLDTGKVTVVAERVEASLAVNLGGQVNEPVFDRHQQISGYLSVSQTRGRVLTKSQIFKGAGLNTNRRSARSQATFNSLLPLSSATGPSSWA